MSLHDKAALKKSPLYGRMCHFQSPSLSTCTSYEYLIRLLVNPVDLIFSVMFIVLLIQYDISKIPWYKRRAMVMKGMNIGALSILGLQNFSWRCSINVD